MALLNRIEKHLLSLYYKVITGYFLHDVIPFRKYKIKIFNRDSKIIKVIRDYLNNKASLRTS
uniref:hypothetical protein n=1 Tax=Chrysotila carterae TaxID=13221 RepID=UPI0022F2A827|nr:hypothetical protein PKF17_pgp084 [Chrysotila carterae]WAK83165.1 hypothetical protein [Chrysotila carterae]